MLVALVVEAHEHRELVVTWSQALEPGGRLAICPVARVRAAPRAQWWSDSVSYGDLDLTGVRSRRQVTDACLVGMADARLGTRLVTLDQASTRTRPQALLIH